jgi:tRNA(adenine34) deaminase
MYFLLMENIFTEILYEEALQEAEMAFERQEIPVAIVVVNNTIIARSHNLTGC